MNELPASRPAPTASGTLAKTPLLHLLLYAFDKKLGGTIELFAPDKRSAAILFKAGAPTKVRTSDPVAYLGRVLLELGHLTEVEVDYSLAELARQKREGPRLHGEILLAQNLTTPGKLHAGLVEQIARKLRFVASLPEETAYAYYDEFDALVGWGGDGAPGVDPVPLFWSILREAPPWAQVQAAIARVGASPLRLTNAADLKRLGLAREESAAAELLRTRPLRIPELSSVGGCDERSARLLAYLLLVTKQVDILPADAAPPISGRHEAAASSVRSPPAPPVAPQPQQAPRATPAPASTPPVQQVAAPPPSAAPESSPSSSRQLRARLPFHSRPPSVRPSPMRTPSARISVAPDAKRNSTAPPPAPAGMSAELAQRWREIAERAATIDRADYFMMLDIARDATTDEVEEAFLGLAKVWHPDRLPSELAPVRDACSRVFARMSEARSALADDEQRARYMKLLADGSGSPEMQETVARVVEAATHFQKAEVCFKRNDLAQAESLCRSAIELDPTQPDYLAMLAWLVALKPENQSPDKTAIAIDQLSRAIKMSDKCEKAYFWRGVLFKRIGREELAVKDFWRVAELNPRNIDAVREVRLHRMRGGRSSQPPPRRSSPAPQKPSEGPTKSGLFGRLFKKP